jgi:hypothetical protein
MGSTSETTKKITTFLLLTAGLSSIFHYLIISGGGLRATNISILVVALMWSPGVAAILTQLLFHRSVKGLGWKWGGTRFQFWSYLLPFAYATCVYIPVWITGLGELTEEVLSQAARRFGLGALPAALTIVLVPVIAGTLGLLPNCLSALGEEIGW